MNKTNTSIVILASKHVHAHYTPLALQGKGAKGHSRLSKSYQGNVASYQFALKLHELCCHISCGIEQ